MYLYSDEEFQYRYQKIYDFLTFQRKVMETPIGYILGGQPGSGKTTLQKIIKEKNANIIVIDGDTFRAYHPRYDEIVRHEDDYVPFTQEFCNKMVETLMD